MLLEGKGERPSGASKAKGKKLCSGHLAQDQKGELDSAAQPRERAYALINEFTSEQWAILGLLRRRLGLAEDLVMMKLDGQGQTDLECQRLRSNLQGKTP